LLQHFRAALHLLRYRLRVRGHHVLPQRRHFVRIEIQLLAHPFVETFVHHQLQSGGLIGVGCARIQDAQVVRSGAHVFGHYLARHFARDTQAGGQGLLINAHAFHLLLIQLRHYFLFQISAHMLSFLVRLPMGTTASGDGHIMVNGMDHECSSSADLADVLANAAQMRPC